MRGRKRRRRRGTAKRGSAEGNLKPPQGLPVGRRRQEERNRQARKSQADRQKRAKTSPETTSEGKKENPAGKTSSIGKGMDILKSIQRKEEETRGGHRSKPGTIHGRHVSSCSLPLQGRQILHNRSKGQEEQPKSKIKKLELEGKDRD